MAEGNDKRNDILLVRSYIMILSEKEVQALLISLEAVEVHGFDNMNRLMGCIAFLKEKMNKEKQEEKDANV